jgi:hypothetical protein
MPGASSALIVWFMNAMSVLRVSDYDLSLYGVLAIVKGASETLVNDRFLALSMVSESSQSFLETLLCASTYAEFFICSEQAYLVDTRSLCLSGI